MHVFWLLQETRVTPHRRKEIMEAPQRNALGPIGIQTRDPFATSWQRLSPIHHVATMNPGKYFLTVLLLVTDFYFEISTLQHLAEKSHNLKVPEINFCRKERKFSFYLSGLKLTCIYVFLHILVLSFGTSDNHWNLRQNKKTTQWLPKQKTAFMWEAKSLVKSLAPRLPNPRWIILKERSLKQTLA